MELDSLWYEGAASLVGSPNSAGWENRVEEGELEWYEEMIVWDKLDKTSGVILEAGASVLHDSGIERLEAGQATKLMYSDDDGEDEWLNEHDPSLRYMYAGGGGEGGV